MSKGDERVFYWPKHDVYCEASELKAYKLKYGHNYSNHKAGEFFVTIWIGKEK